MKIRISALLLAATAFLFAVPASADEYTDTIAVFKKAGESAAFFDNSYAYLVFPNVGKGGLGVGAAHGSGRAYEQGKYVGDVKLNQVSIGLQAGGQAFSQSGSLSLARNAMWAASSAALGACGRAGRMLPPAASASPATTRADISGARPRSRCRPPLSSR